MDTYQYLRDLLGPKATASLCADGPPTPYEITRLSDHELSERVGPARAKRLRAAFELGRIAIETERQQGAYIRCSKDVYDVLEPTLRHVDTERVVVLLLNNRHRIVETLEVSRGGVSAAAITPADVFRRAIQVGAPKVILAHNHPSGDVTPSPEDRTLTKRVKDAGQALGIPLLDHVIIGDGDHYSFRELDRALEWDLLD